MKWEDLYKRAYVPYSGKQDACVVLGSEGGFYVGVRIENVSFPLTISCVQAACSISLSYGENPKTIYVNSNDEPQLKYWAQEFDCDILVGELPANLNLANYSEQAGIEKVPILKKLLDYAVAGNSNFPVSAIISSDSGHYTGVNIEVSDWAKGLCAERVALCKAIADGVKTFQSLSVHTLKGEFSSPCGACRQVLFEHLPLSKAELYHANGTYSEHFILDLLPFSFTSKDLFS